MTRLVAIVAVAVAGCFGCRPATAPTRIHPHGETGTIYCRAYRGCVVNGVYLPAIEQEH